MKSKWQMLNGERRLKASHDTIKCNGWQLWNSPHSVNGCFDDEDLAAFFHLSSLKVYPEQQQFVVCSTEQLWMQTTGMPVDPCCWCFHVLSSLTGFLLKHVISLFALRASLHFIRFQTVSCRSPEEQHTQTSSVISNHGPHESRMEICFVIVDIGGPSSANIVCWDFNLFSS